ncbi:MAG: hypothetical protein C4530_13020 [Desulfobacteraceae bacterium]|nr:MAG: hypothetical protein C4530_13020 [Desulfobacteraceae bacterium]
MKDGTKKRPLCFGILDVVFPKGKGDLRSTPEKCMGCSCKVECLRSAVSGRDGLEVKEEMVDRAYSSGRITFLERWSRKKALDRSRKDRKEDGC